VPRDWAPYPGGVHTERGSPGARPAAATHRGVRLGAPRGLDAADDRPRGRARLLEPGRWGAPGRARARHGRREAGGRWPVGVRPRAALRALGAPPGRRAGVGPAPGGLAPPRGPAGPGARPRPRPRGRRATLPSQAPGGHGAPLGAPWSAGGQPRGAPHACRGARAGGLGRGRAVRGPPRTPRGVRGGGGLGGRGGLAGGRRRGNARRAWTRTRARGTPAPPGPGGPARREQQRAQPSGLWPAGVPLASAPATREGAPDADTASLQHTQPRLPPGRPGAPQRGRGRALPPSPAHRASPHLVTRPVMATSARRIRRHGRPVVAVTGGRTPGHRATISTRGGLRCGVGGVVLRNATLHDNGPPYLIFGAGIEKYENNFS